MILKEGERLIHYTRRPLDSVRSVPQGGKAGVYKPCGLWVSVEGLGHFGWKDWCESEEWGALANAEGQAKTLMYEIVLAADANILRLSTPGDIDQFTSEYAADRHPGQEPDWQRFAAKYQGIIIAPYSYERRMTQHTLWYYGWDCASGCIWDAAAIAEVRSPL